MSLTEDADGVWEALDHLIDKVQPEDVARVVDKVIRTLIEPNHESLSWGDRLMTLDKSIGFRSDPAFADALAKLSTSTGQTQYQTPDGIAWRLNTLVWAARTALAVKGDFVECGVFEGEMSWVVSQVIDLSAAGRSFYLYDTFDGFSDKYSSAETDYPHNPSVFALHDEVYRQSHLHGKVLDLFANQPNVHVIKGVVPDSLEGTSPEQIAYLHIDMNSPGPEIAALERLFDRVSPGGVIVLDDYGWLVHRVQKAADDAFFAARGYTVLEMPTGQGLVVKR